MLNQEAPIVIDQVFHPKTDACVVRVVEVFLNHTSIISHGLNDGISCCLTMGNYCSVSKDSIQWISIVIKEVNGTNGVRVARKGRVNGIVRLESTCHIIDIAALTIVIKRNACGKLAGNDWEVQHDFR